MAAEKVTPEAINFMAKHGRGLICLTLEEQKVRDLGLPPMASDNTAQHGTAFTVSIEARRGVTTGISAADRATTILAAIAADARPDDLVRPGHIFPLKAVSGGVLRRAGQTENSVDLRVGRAVPAGGHLRDHERRRHVAPFRSQEVRQEARLKIGTIADLIRYRMTTTADTPRRAPVIPMGAQRFRASYERRDSLPPRARQGEFGPKDKVLVGALGASPVMSSARSAAIAASSSSAPWDDHRSGPQCDAPGGRGIGCSASCGLRRCRTRGWTRSRPTCASASRRTCDYGRRPDLADSVATCG
jgi:3,4-dihydroxy 2-butanone 4-phosphate synthase/GTP cyclohydrolase II